MSIGNVLPAADIAQFKQGVKSVAGKMAVLANGVMNSLQVRLHYNTFRKAYSHAQGLSLYPGFCWNYCLLKLVENLKPVLSS